MNECLTTPQHKKRSAIGCQNKVDVYLDGEKYCRAMYFMTTDRVHTTTSVVRLYIIEVHTCLLLLSDV